MSVPTASINDLDLNWCLDGTDGELVLLVNSLADTLDDWAPQVEALVGAGYRVLRFDQRGVGERRRRPVPHTTAGLAANALGLLEHVGAGPVHVIGFTLGGLVAQELALARPDLVRSLTLSSAYAAPGPYCVRLLDFWAELATAMGVEALLRDATLSAFTQAYFEDPNHALAHLEDVVAQDTDLGLDELLRMLAAMRHHDTRGRVGRLSASGVPTLVLAAEEDAQVPPGDSLALHEALPGSRWVLTPGGHGAAIEFPQAVNAALVGFLASVSAPEAP